ncbi:MAG: alpha-amylase, partial [Gammaproteobacteria bacterium]|nr:alpha-amylase [Gammaproteobacteria bacterium]
PNVTQYTLQLGDSIFSFWRQSLKRDQSIFCLNNVTNRPQQLLMSDLNLIDNESWFDLIGENSYGNGSNEIVLEPYQSAWLTNCRY